MYNNDENEIGGSFEDFEIEKQNSQLNMHKQVQSVFGYLCSVNFEEMNKLDDYLQTLPEFKEWDETGFEMNLRRKVFIKAKGNLRINIECEEDGLMLIKTFRKYKLLSKVLREKVKLWCKENL